MKKREKEKKKEKKKKKGALVASLVLSAISAFFRFFCDFLFFRHVRHYRQKLDPFQNWSESHAFHRTNSSLLILNAKSCYKSYCIRIRRSHLTTRSFPFSVPIPDGSHYCCFGSVDHGNRSAKCIVCPLLLLLRGERHEQRLFTMHSPNSSVWFSS
jgi:hypothetical protein